MELIDSHCHLDLPEFDGDRTEVIERAREAGVVHMITIGIDPASSAAAVDLAAGYDFISATVGHHPHDASRLAPQDLDRLKELAQSPQVVGFGEIGLDFFRNISPPKVQRRCFDQLLDLGLELGLPIIIHDRDAHQEVLEHLKAADAGKNGGVIHCYSGDWPLAKKFLDLGFHLSFPGTITFPKADDMRLAAREAPLDRILIETDAPFLAPQPKRGRRNEPALVKHTLLKLAELRGLDPEETARTTTDNARSLFGLGGGN